MAFARASAESAPAQEKAGALELGAAGLRDVLVRQPREGVQGPPAGPVPAEPPGASLASPGEAKVEIQPEPVRGFGRLGRARRGAGRGPRQLLAGLGGGRHELSQAVDWELLQTAPRGRGGYTGSVVVGLLLLFALVGLKKLRGPRRPG